MSSGARKDLERAISDLVRQGWTATVTRKGRRVVAPNGAVITCSMTPSDQNAVNAFLRDVRRVKATLTETTGAA